MRCPRCAGRELRIGVILTGMVICRSFEGRPLEVIDAGTFDSFWNPKSDSECCGCGWTGKVAEAAETRSEIVQIAEDEPTDCVSIELEPGVSLIASV